MSAAIRAEGWTALRGIAQLVTNDPSNPDASAAEPADRPLGLVRDAAVLVRGDRIAWVGAARGLDDAIRARVGASSATVSTRDLGGRVVIPGLVDNHTHLVFGGDRVEEFRLRVTGRSYEEIAAAGGGIASTVRATRAWSEEALLRSTERRLERLLAWGVTTVEIKSGYGLSTEDELKQLRVVRALGERGSQLVVPTFLGAHVVPKEHRADPERYVDLVVEEMLPEVARGGWARYCDVFCERGAFDVRQTRRILERAAALGLGIRVHAEQLTHTGGTALAVELGAASVDHLEHIDESDVRLLAESATVATLLPGATVFLGKSRWAPARALLDAGVRVALSTDCNPGSCMTENLPLIGTLGCVQMGLDPAEALLAVTREPAFSLGLAHEVGAIRAGMRADLVWLQGARYENLFYHFGVQQVAGVMVAGREARLPTDSGGQSLPAPGG